MPITLFLVAGIAAWLLYRDAIGVVAARERRAFALLLGVLTLMAVSEWWLFLSGEIYANGIAWRAMLRPLLFIAFVASLAAWRNARLRPSVAVGPRRAASLLLAVLTAASFLI